MLFPLPCSHINCESFLSLSYWTFRLKDLRRWKTNQLAIQFLSDRFVVFFWAKHECMFFQQHENGEEYASSTSSTFIQTMKPPSIVAIFIMDSLWSRGIAVFFAFWCVLSSTTLWFGFIIRIVDSSNREAGVFYECFVRCKLGWLYCSSFVMSNWRMCHLLI